MRAILAASAAVTCMNGVPKGRAIDRDYRASLALSEAIIELTKKQEFFGSWVPGKESTAAPLLDCSQPRSYAFDLPDLVATMHQVLNPRYQ